MEDAIHFAFGISGNVFGTLLFLAPAITFYRVIKKGTTEEFSGLPYVAALFNCLLYTWYGLPLVTSHNILVTINNGVGTALEVTYVTLYLVYAPAKYRTKILGLFVAELVLFAAIVVISFTVLHHTPRSLFVGVIAATLSVCMYAAPLSIMKTVIQTKSVEFMPFFLSFFVFMCSLSWFIYGVIGRDLFVAIPNGLGTALGATQLLLYAIYRKPIKKTEDSKGDLETSKPTKKTEDSKADPETSKADPET